MQSKYSSITVSIPSSHADLLGDLLDELGSLGSEVHDGEPVTYVAYFEGGDNLDTLVRLISIRMADAGLAESDVSIATGDVPDRDWEAEWRQTLSPIRVGRSWLIRPSWQPGDAFDRLEIIIDPKMAFGTGTHATTQLCLVEIEDMIKPGASVLDVGAGTAILSIGAALLGAKPVLAVEIDEVAVDCARENVTLNGVADTVELVTGTLDDVAPRTYDVVVANIECRTLLQIAPALRTYVAPGGTTIFSGILEIEADRFCADLVSLGWRNIRRRRQYDPMTDDGWVSVVATPVE